MSADQNNLLSPIGGQPSSPPAGGGLSPVGGAQPGQMPTLGGVGGPPTTPPVVPPPGQVGYSAGNAAPPSAPAGPFGQPAPPTAPAVYVDESEAAMKKLWMGLGGAAVVGLAVVLFLLFRTPPPVPAPSGFTKFTAGDGTFTCDTPEGWSTVATGEAAGEKDSVKPNAVTMTSGNAQVEVSMSTVAGLVKGQLLFGNEVVPEGMQGSRANGVDKFHKPAVRKRYKGYAETKQPDCPSNMGGVIVDEATKDFKTDAVLYEWTASGNSWGLGGKMHGYRAVLAGTELIASVTCQCSESDWPKLKPAFLRVIGSLQETGPKRGGGMNIPGAGNVRTPTGM